jgi:hypoxanthine phosphoribosyltransferase
MNIDNRSSIKRSLVASSDRRAAFALVFLSAFERRVDADPETCRALLETLVADQRALTAYRTNLEGFEVGARPIGEGAGLMLDDDLIDRVVHDGLGAVPDSHLAGLFSDPDALLTLQVAVQCESIRREDDGDGSPWFWGGSTRPGVAEHGPVDGPEGLIEVLPESVIRGRVDQLCAEIASDYAGKPLMIVPVLTGGGYFAMDLHRGLASLGPRYDPVVARSYAGTRSGRLSVDLDMLDQIPFADRDVLVVDDILDTGQTLNEVTRQIRRLGPASVRTCVLLQKDLRDEASRPARPYPLSPDYVGFTVSDAFVVGYGLDYEGSYRELRGIYELPSTAQWPRVHGARILIRLGGCPGPTPMALPLSWLEARNLGPVAFEEVRLTFEFCARRGWSEGPQDDGLHCEVVHEFHEGRWEPGEVLRAPISRRDFDDALDRVRVSLECRIDGQHRTTVTGLTRGAITRGSQGGPEPGSYCFEKVWPVIGSAAAPLSVD